MSTDVPVCPVCNLPRPSGSWPICEDGSGKHGHVRPHGGSRIDAIHQSERSVIYKNARTGEIRFPARADVPMPAVYANQGYERQELASASQIRTFERESGRIHERSHYDIGQPTAERDLAGSAASPQAIKTPQEQRRSLGFGE